MNLPQCMDLLKKLVKELVAQNIFLFACACFAQGGQAQIEGCSGKERRMRPSI